MAGGELARGQRHQDRRQVSFADESGVVSPGDSTEISFDLGKPVGIEQGMRFAIREGGKTVGAGLVTDVIA